MRLPRELGEARRPAADDALLKQPGGRDAAVSLRERQVKGLFLCTGRQYFKIYILNMKSYYGILYYMEYLIIELCLRLSERFCAFFISLAYKFYLLS